MKAYRLPIELFIHRYGWLPIVAALLVGGSLWLHLFGTPEEVMRSELGHQELAAMKAGQGVRTSSLEEPLILQRHRVFRDHLARREALPDVIRTLFSLAERNGLVLYQAEYSLARRDPGGYSVYRVSAPVTGAYSSVRNFVQAVLASTPSAALEDATFRRGSVSAPTTEARLRFAIYLREGE